MGKIKSRKGPVQDSQETPKTSGASPENPTTSKLRPVEVRKELIEAVRDTVGKLREMKMDSLADRIMGIVAKASRNQFSVAFVGEFSHGKSTLLNKLLGGNILPTDDLPTTAMLTKIGYGKKEEIEVLDNRGKIVARLPLEAQSWKDLVAFDDDGNANRTYSDGYLRVAVDNEWLKASNLNLLDTPGANDGSIERDAEISRALMATDGAVLCVDAQKGLMDTQLNFIKDRLLAPKVPYMALAITHLDLIAEERRPKILAFILGALHPLKLEMPVVVTTDVPLDTPVPGVTVGLEGLKKLLGVWSVNPERSERIGKWLAANVRSVLEIGLQSLQEQLGLLSLKEEERRKMIVEKQAGITALHDEWERLRGEMKERYESCVRDFERKLKNETGRITEALRYRLEVVPDPARWYAQSYDYELSNQISGTIISLDNFVTETARNDFDWMNRELVKAYKTGLERESKIWRRTEDPACYTSGTAPEMKNISEMQDKQMTSGAIATAAGGLLGALFFGVGGMIGTIGASTAVRFLQKQKIGAEIERARYTLSEFIPGDVEKVLNEAIRNSAGRIRLVYEDIIRASKVAESTWMETQHKMIEEASKPNGEAVAKAVEKVGEKVSLLEEMSAKLQKFID